MLVLSNVVGGFLSEQFYSMVWGMFSGCLTFKSGFPAFSTVPNISAINLFTAKIRPIRHL